MAWNIRERKTEHSGAKHGNGAYWGPKAIAKHASKKERRINNRLAVASALGEVQPAVVGGGTMISDQRTRRRVGRRHST